MLVRFRSPRRCPWGSSSHRTPCRALHSHLRRGRAAAPSCGRRVCADRRLGVPADRPALPLNRKFHLYLAWQADGLHNALDDQVDSARHALNNSSIGSPRRIRSKTLFLAVAPGLLFAAGEGAAKTVGTACISKAGEVYALAPYRSAPRMSCLDGDETVRLSLEQPDTAFAKKRHTIGPTRTPSWRACSSTRNS